MAKNLMIISTDGEKAFDKIQHHLFVIKTVKQQFIKIPVKFIKIILNIQYFTGTVSKYELLQFGEVPPLLRNYPRSLRTARSGRARCSGTRGGRPAGAETRRGHRSRRCLSGASLRPASRPSAAERRSGPAHAPSPRPADPQSPGAPEPRSPAGRSSSPGRRPPHPPALSPRPSGFRAVAPTARGPIGGPSSRNSAGYWLAEPW
ncbi:PREDICTED: translation initiation factor IF-2-like [Chinchilla lanigera]|uniref:translation initiation factor IF-2-like n=1 Tax=Chinchilla lanigera TaxID=34839 RepID=UPI000696227D|nr:PREDICTED: translation initiation factor IF-2-like [Chinchilla lanigera]